MRDKRIALVHEWFGATGGSENVFLAMAELFPDSPRFVLWKDHDADPGIELRESWVGRTPLRRAKFLALPVMPLAWRSLTSEHFDIVLSSSHAFAHTVKLGDEATKHLSYVHSPARYVWSPELDRRGESALLKMPRAALKMVDRRLSRHVTAYAANSIEVQQRIQRYWKRDAVVINPPVDVDYFAAAPAEQRAQPRDYLLAMGRWITYKNFDLAIDIADAAGRPLIIAGSGPQEAELRRRAQTAGVRVDFEVRPSRERLRELFWGAYALLFPAHEDFGIVPLEAQSCGTPVLGLARGGLLETVRPEQTGLLVDSLDPAAYARLVPHLAALDRDVIQKHAESYSRPMFQARITEWVEQEGR